MKTFKQFIDEGWNDHVTGVRVTFNSHDPENADHTHAVHVLRDNGHPVKMSSHKSHKEAIAAAKSFAKNSGVKKSNVEDHTV